MLAIVFTHSALPQKGFPDLSMTAERSLMPVGLSIVPQYPVESRRQRSSAPSEIVKVVVSRNFTLLERMRMAFTAYCPEFLISITSVLTASASENECDALDSGYTDV